MRKTLVVLLLVASLFAFVSCKDVKYTDEIASLNGVVYSSLQKAIDDAADGDTVKLLCNVTGKGAEIGSSITLDFGGHTYTFDDNVEIGTKLADLPQIGLRVKSGVEVTLKDAKLEAVDTFTAPFISSEGTLKLEETTIAPEVGKVALDILSGSVTVDEESAVSGVVNISSDSTAKINFDVEPKEVFYTGAVEGKITYAGKTPATEIKASKATIGNKGYETFEAALDDLEAGEAITLLESLNLTTTLELGKDCTINLNGFDITATGSRAIHVKEGNVEITGKGEISATGGLRSSSSVIRVGQSDNIAASLTIGKDVTVSTDKCYGISVFNGKSGTTTESVSLTVNGKVSSTDVPAISGCGNDYNGTTNITIGSTAVIMTTNENAIYFPCAGELTVNGKVTGKGGIEMKSGATTVSVGSNAKIEATADSTKHTPSGNGSSTSGYAFVIANNSGYKGGATATINGGTIIGTIAIVDDDNTVAEAKKGKISITGGSFTMNVKEFVANGYECTGAESEWTVGPAK